MKKRLLIANRGEVAARVAHAAADHGWESVAVHTPDDASGLHLRRADDVAELPERGVRGYLDAASLVDIALEHQCTAVHPGWGFLAENAEFAERCAKAGVVFVGPTPAQLRLFGDKLAARALAAEVGVATLAGSDPLDGVEALNDFARSLQGADYVLKAAAGGGGRGMQVVRGADHDEAGAQAFVRCAAEAAAAFGDGTVYAERYLAHALHIEVQIVGDADGQVAHLWERDCSLQRRHQKIVEMAPALGLPEPLRERVLDAALGLARHVSYQNLGTFEFLVDVANDALYFIEANPRLQVEHTVTEAITGLDLVGLQLAIAAGSSLPSLGLGEAPPPVRGSAVQLRINAETMQEDGHARVSGGTVTRFELAQGAGVRVDTSVSAGDALNPAFDSLLAKLIVHSHQSDLGSLLSRAGRAAAESSIDGVATNLPFLRAVLAHPSVQQGNAHTRFIDANAAALVEQANIIAAQEERRTQAPPIGPATTHVAAPPGADTIAAPMPGSVISVEVSVGEAVKRGQPLLILEAMKMHHVIEASAPGVVAGTPVAPGDTVAETDALIFVHAVEDDGTSAEVVDAIDVDAPRADLDEVNARHALGLDENRPESVAKRRKVGGRTARENVADLCDPDSFIEYGALAIAAQRRRRTLEDLMERTPADGMIAGIGTVNADHFGPDDSRCAVLAYDYTVLAGTQGHVNHKKKDRLFELALEWELPVVFFTEGGGGRPGDVDTEDLLMSWLDITTFTTWPRLSGVAPRIAVNFGRCFAGNAVVFGCADITIATTNSNIGLAGPAMIEGGGLGKFTPEDIGPIDVQTANGVVDLACEDEASATAAARQLLGYFQGPTPEWSAPDQRRLRHIIPEDRLRVYDIRKVLHGLADEGSVIELRRDYGVGLITAFIRIEGQPFGVIANDPTHLGGAIDGDGGEKGGRFLQLCDAYAVPVVSLCDTPGYMVGPESEKTAAVRRGSRLILASANLGVPLFTVVLRKAYGLGAQAMAGGGMHEPFFTIGWPTAEFGPMGLEGAVELGFRKELDAISDPVEQRALYDKLVAEMYAKGKGVSVAQTFEVDAVIDPAETRRWLLRGLRATRSVRRKSRGYIDVW